MGLACFAISTGIASAQDITPANCWPYNQNYSVEINETIYPTTDSLPNLEGLINISLADEHNIISAEVYYNAPEETQNQINSLTITIGEAENYLTYGRYSDFVDGTNDTLTIESMPFFFIPETAEIAITATDNLGQTYFVTDTIWEHDIDLTIIVDANGYNEQIHVFGGSEAFPFGALLKTFPASTGLNISYRSTPPFYGHIHEIDKLSWSKYGCWLHDVVWPFNPDLKFGIGIHRTPHPGSESQPLGGRYSFGCMRTSTEGAEWIYNNAEIGDKVICIKNDYEYDIRSDLFNQEDYEGFASLPEIFEEYKINVENGTVAFGYYPNNLIVDEVLNFGSLINEGCQNWECVEFEDLEDFIEHYINPIFTQ